MRFTVTFDIKRGSAQVTSEPLLPIPLAIIVESEFSPYIDMYRNQATMDDTTYENIKNDLLYVLSSIKSRGHHLPDDISFNRVYK
jgi:hypothetical protein